MQSCWEERPELRPAFSDITHILSSTVLSEAVPNLHSNPKATNAADNRAMTTNNYNGQTVLSPLLSSVMTLLPPLNGDNSKPGLHTDVMDQATAVSPPPSVISIVSAASTLSAQTSDCNHKATRFSFKKKRKSKRTGNNSSTSSRRRDQREDDHYIEMNQRLSRKSESGSIGSKRHIQSEGESPKNSVMHRNDHTSTLDAFLETKRVEVTRNGSNASDYLSMCPAQHIEKKGVIVTRNVSNGSDYLSMCPAQPARHIDKKGVIVTRNVSNVSDYLSMHPADSAKLEVCPEAKQADVARKVSNVSDYFPMYPADPAR